MNTELEKVKHRVWITERCHMNAEKRNRRYELYFHILLACYSISAIGYNIIGTGSTEPLSDEVFLLLSVCTLALSLLIFGFKFGETAAQHRACYLALQRLRFESHTADTLNSAYVGIIGSLPNHTTHDFHNLAIDDLFSKEQKLQTAESNPYEFSIFERVKFAFAHLAIWATAFAMFAPAIYIIIKTICPEWLNT